MPEKLLAILSPLMGLVPEKIQPDMCLYEYCDEIDIAEIIVDIEDAFDIEIPDEVVDSWVYVRDIVDYLEKTE